MNNVLAEISVHITYNQICELDINDTQRPGRHGNRNLSPMFSSGTKAECTNSSVTKTHLNTKQ